MISKIKTIAALGLALLLAPSHAVQARAEGGRVHGRITAEGGLHAGMVVYIEKAPQAAGARSEKARIVQRNLAFDPASLVVVQGQEVDFPNDDKFFHNVFSLTPGNQFDLGLYRGGASKTALMRTPGETVVYCNIHPNMVARILVLQNDLYASVGDDGSYTITGIPDGTYTVVAWSAAHEPQRRSVTVRSGGAVKIDFKLARRKDGESHLNKNGEQYGRYK